MKNETCPFYIACQKGHFDIVKLLLSKDAGLHLRKRNGESPLIVACRNGHYKIVEHLLDNGAEINMCWNLKLVFFQLLVKKDMLTLCKGYYIGKQTLIMYEKRSKSFIYGLSGRT